MRIRCDDAKRALKTTTRPIPGTLTGGYQTTIPDRGNNVTILSVGVDCGGEFFIGDSWSLRVGPTYRYAHESMSNSSSAATANIYGINWALAGYF
jgi:hypothetical protein